jgi:general secretion pathway protein L
MSLLIIKLPARERLGARTPAVDSGLAQRLPAEWSFVFCVDGRTAGPLSQATAGLLPKADRVVLALAPADVSWHRVLVPKAPPARLRAALAGVMEDVLLDTDETTHLALAHGATPGADGWVAATHGPRLAAALQALETAGVAVDQVVPAGEPTGVSTGVSGSTVGAGVGAGDVDATGFVARGHFFTTTEGHEPAPWLQLARGDGVLCVRLAGALSRALQPAAGTPVRYTATPAAAVAAEQWLGSAVPLQTEAEHLLECAQSRTNLRQFDLAVRHRGTRALRDVGKRFFSRDWRAVRWGLIALAALHVLGLNAYAWQQRSALQNKRASMDQLLRTAHPSVRAVLDAPLQMATETERLRATAGRVGADDFEALLAATAAAWPDAQAPVQTLRFEPGRLTLAAPNWPEADVTALRTRLSAQGLAVESAEGRLTIARAAAAAATANGNSAGTAP